MSTLNKQVTSPRLDALAVTILGVACIGLSIFLPIGWNVVALMVGAATLLNAHHLRHQS